MNADDARKAEMQARAKVRGIEDGAQLAGREAERAAREQYEAAHGIAEARVALRDAVIARVAAEDALPPHEWEGRRVYRVEPAHWRSSGAKRLEGVVETVRSTTKFAENAANWRRPSIGEPIVRLLKKDGAPGLKFETMTGYRNWRLVEPAQAMSAGTAETAPQAQGDSPPARSEGCAQ